MLPARAQAIEAAAKSTTPHAKILAAPVEIAERAAQQNQRREEERVTFDYPLRLAGSGVKLALKSPAARR